MGGFPWLNRARMEARDTYRTYVSPEPRLCRRSTLVAEGGQYIRGLAEPPRTVST